MGTFNQIINTGINALNRQNNSHFTTLRDYQHASRIFTPNHSSLLPKSKNWFHIFFELDPVVISAVNASLGAANASFRINWDPDNLPILGILAKTVKLPGFKFDVKKNNQYNRWSLTNTKINYDPVEVSFWDDTVDTIRGFWYAYYQYMVQDPKYVNFEAAQSQGIAIPFQWMPSINNLETLYSTPSNWGVNYGLDTTNAAGSPLNRTNPFFRSIRIYQFNRQTNSDPSVGPQYTEYVLVNPVISSFDHDTVDFSTSEYMQNKMTIEFETVLYNSGLVEDDEIASWDAVLQRFFDNTPSPLSGINPNVNEANQLGSVLASSFILGTEISQVARNTGQATTSTVLAAAIGTEQTIQAAINGPTNLQLQVPTVVDGYGTGGQPPTLPPGIVPLIATKVGL
jgi:hypothetical protein